MDQLDDLLTYAHAAPLGWCDPHGYPLSWGHYVQVLRAVPRWEARATVAHADATRMASTDTESYRDWRQTVQTIGGG